MNTWIFVCWIIKTRWSAWIGRSRLPKTAYSRPASAVTVKVASVEGRNGLVTIPSPSPAHSDFGCAGKDFPSTAAAFQYGVLARPRPQNKRPLSLFALLFLDPRPRTCFGPRIIIPKSLSAPYFCGSKYEDLVGDSFANPP